MWRFKTTDLPELTPASLGLLDERDVRAAIGATLLRLGARADALRYLQAPPATGTSEPPQFTLAPQLAPAR